MKPTGLWMWHFGDFEIYHSLQLHSRRQEFGADYPCFWQLHTPHPIAKFLKQYSGQGGYISAHTNGKGYLLVDGQRYPTDTVVRFPSGDHTFEAVIQKQDGLPALYIDSDVCPGDATWLCNHNAGEFHSVGTDPFFDHPQKNPEIFPFAYEEKHPSATEETANGILFDFGKELFGLLHIQNASTAPLSVYYGESREEALDTAHTLVWEQVNGATQYTLTKRAFRYVYVQGADTSTTVYADYEYLPLTYKGSFSCNESLFKQVYDTCAYTFHLNCREGFLDGIKRDRWVWSGDAYQSARINAYLFADPAVVRRTFIGMAGKLPVEQFINTILDYTTLFIIGLYEYYMTYGDLTFLDQMLPLAQAHLSFCETRLNADGFMEEQPGDWTFVDWSDIEKDGPVCAEQMLLAAAYDSMARILTVLKKDGTPYREKSAALKSRIREFFWDAQQGAFIDGYRSGNRHVTRHANIFAVMYDIATPEETADILQNVLKNDRITKITTPYFKGYELDVLAKLGEFDELEQLLHSYWGGMLKLGATTIWEAFDPTQSGTEHYEMYGNRYGKSLCHAWGSTPIYLFGRYYLGVYPTTPGYATFHIEPHVGGLESFKGTVPLNETALAHVTFENGHITVLVEKEGGTLLWNGKQYPLQANVPFTV